MTDTELRDYQPHPLLRIKPGDVTQSWCSRHWDRTDHLWTGHLLICLDCHPELKPESEAA
jgi:hypothetical protein